MDTIETYLDKHENKNLLRFITCGSVDDGKSTLIGRLLADSKLIYDDQLGALREASAKNGTTGAGEIDYALLLDGLKAEREQGITIDVAYRYFSTPRRTFIIADTPGHEQYTRNMATGASTANLAIILIDARYGVVTQTRRHAFIASLLGIRHLLVAINKMDIGGYSEATFAEIRDTFADFARNLEIPDIRYVPISALKGTNVADRSPDLTPWYDGPSLLELLETIDISHDLNRRDFRFPVQVVIRPHLNFRGFAGSVASGAVRPGEKIRVLPSGKTSTVKRIVTADGDLPEAVAPQAVTLELADEVDVSSGDMIVHDDNPPRVADRFEATVIWMNETPLRPGTHLLVRHAGRFVKAHIAALHVAVDVNTLAESPAAELPLNGIGRVTIETTLPLYVDAYGENRATGSLIFVDPISNVTTGAALIAAVAPAAAAPLPATHAHPDFRWETSRLTPHERLERNRHAGQTVLIVAAEPAAALDFGRALEQRLFRLKLHTAFLALPETGGPDHDEQIERLGELARHMTDAGVVFVTALAASEHHAVERLAVLGQPNHLLVVALGDAPDTPVPPTLVLDPTAAPDRNLAAVLALLAERKG